MILFDIFCRAILPGYCLSRLSSVGKDYELGRRAKRVLACAVVRLHLFKLSARRQLRFRALQYPRKKIPCIVKVNTTIAKKHMSSMGSEPLVVYYRFQNTINKRSLSELSIADYTRQRKHWGLFVGGHESSNCKSNIRGPEAPRISFGSPTKETATVATAGPETCGRYYWFPRGVCTRRR
jgi:hypothetical protein